MAATGDFPRELKVGILTPLPKPGKPKGPPSNLRPIILLSIIRKILTISMMRRTWDRMQHLIPLSQAAYQAGRSTTEQVFAVKALAEKAITSNDYTVHIIMLDMSKAFDTVDRGKLFKMLHNILLPEELHLLNLLVNDVSIKVRVGQETGEEINTLLGIMQGDCLSAILFIVYLAQVMTPSMPTHQAEHSYAVNALLYPVPTSPKKPIHQEDHSYASKPRPTSRNKTLHQRKPFMIDPKYADDITWLAVSTPTTTANMTELEENIPPMLKEGNLTVNDTKTENFTIPQQQQEDPNWRKCKLLGSIIDTQEDIKRRKGLLLTHMKAKKKIYHSRRLSNTFKVRYFVAFAESVFLYNCELWTLTQTEEKKIDAFHRRQLRWALGIFYPRIITCKELYNATKQEPWSAKIRRRRMSFLGHLCRLHEDTPARKALTEALRTIKKKKGGQKNTWLKNIKYDLAEASINIELAKPTEVLHKIIELAANRKEWSSVVRHVMSGTPYRGATDGQPGGCQTY